MKKFVSLFLAIIITASVLATTPMHVYASTSSDGLLYAYIEETDSYSVKGCTATLTGDVIIPESYNGKPVTAISAICFKDNTKITSVSIPDSVTTISKQAFQGCKNLKSVDLPDGIKTLETSVFSGCTNLISINIPDSVTTIKSGAFNSCRSLETIVIPYGVTTIEEAFLGCDSLENISLPDSTQHIIGTNFYDSAYAKNESNWDGYVLYIDNILIGTKPIFEITEPLEIYEIREGTITIATGAFESYKSLHTIVFPDSLKHINNYAFYNCSALNEVVFPNKLETIGEYAFSYCSKLKTVTIPGTVEKIERYIFSQCKHLETLIIEDGAKSMKSQAFDQCGRLHTVSIPDSLTDLTISAFSSTGIYNNPDYWDGEAFYVGNHLIFGGIDCPRFYTIKPGTVSIAAQAFSASDNLVCLTIPDSVRVINDLAFPISHAFSAIIYTGSSEDFAKIELPSIINSVKDVTIAFGKNASEIPAKPTTKSVVNVAGGVQVTWNTVPNADIYLVYRRGAGSNNWEFIGSSTSNSLIDNYTPHNQYLRYSVQAINGLGASPFDYTGKYLKHVTTPKLRGISNATNGIYVKWDEVPSASGYRVYRRGAGEKYWTYITTVKTPYYTDTAVKNSNGKYYRYTVRAVVGGVYSGYEDGIYIKRLTNPTIKSVTNTNSGITVKWSAVSGTTGYYVYKKTANSNWQLCGVIRGTNNTTFTDILVNKGTTYTYTVRAVYGSTLSYFNSGTSCKRR